MKIKKLLYIVLLFVPLFIFQSCSKGDPDILYVNGKIHTMDSVNTIAEAVAVKDGKILAVGSTEELKQKYSGINEVDLGGKVVLPGFIDAEGSVVEYSKNLNVLSLASAKSVNEVLEMVRQRVNEAPLGSWIAGFGWNEILIPVEELQKINKTQLDEISTEHNIYLINLNGDAIWVNSKLLESAGINKDTESPENGEIEIGEDGEPTGLLFDGALSLVRDKIPELTDGQMREFVKAGTSELLTYGITTVQDRTVGLGTIELFKDLIDSNNLPIRIYAVLSAGDVAFEEYVEKGILENYKDRLTVRSVSLDYDGALEFQRAILLEQYLKEPTIAEAFNGLGEIENVMKRAFEKNFQVRIKAVGDKAALDVLEIVERVKRETNESDRRTVIEHIEFTNEEILAKVSELKVIPSIRPDIGMYDMQLIESMVGEKYLTNIANWQSLLKSSGMIITGTDFPFHMINPFIQIYYLTTRKQIGGNNFVPPNPNQVISLEDAIRSLTIWSAFACFQEKTKGSIEEGKFADMIVLSEDIFANNESLLNVKVEKTIVGGEILFGTK